MSDLVPFGKHKGKPVDALMDDRPYLDWLMTQGWFKERHDNIYQVVINNGQEPSETPEHNAMQIRFLNEEYRLKVAYLLKGDILFAYASMASIQKRLAKFYKEIAAVIIETTTAWREWRNALVPKPIKRIEQRFPSTYAEIMAVDTNVQDYIARQWDMYKADLVNHLNKMDALPAGEQGDYDQRYKPKMPTSLPTSNDQFSTVIEESPRELPTDPVSEFTDLQFRVAPGPKDESSFSELIRFSTPSFESQGVDVGFRIGVGVSAFIPTRSYSVGSRLHGQSEKHFIWSIRWPFELDLRRVIEVPSLEAHFSFSIELKPTVGDDYPAVLRQMKRNDASVLVIGAYCGVGATQDEFIQFFKTQGVTVIFEADIHNTVLPPFDRKFEGLKISDFINAKEWE